MRRARRVERWGSALRALRSTRYALSRFSRQRRPWCGREVFLLRQREDRLELGLRRRRKRRETLHSLGRLQVEIDLLIPIHARAGRNQVPDDDVLLEPKQIVLRATNRRVRQNSRGLLERRRRDERLRRQARLGDAEQQRLGRRRRLLLLLRAIVDLAEDLLIDVLALEELRFARLEDANLLQHLPDDDPDVLVVVFHALQAIDLLHLVQQILLHRPRTLDAQDVVRIHRTLGEAVTGTHAIALVHAQVLARGDLVRLCLHRLIDRAVVVDRVDADLALAALDLAEPNDTVDLGDRRRI